LQNDLKPKNNINENPRTSDFNKIGEGKEDIIHSPKYSTLSGPLCVLSLPPSMSVPLPPPLFQPFPQHYTLQSQTEDKNIPVSRRPHSDSIATIPLTMLNTSKEGRKRKRRGRS
jgi:hypothetical protein